MSDVCAHSHMCSMIWHDSFSTEELVMYANQSDMFLFVTVFNLFLHVIDLMSDLILHMLIFPFAEGGGESSHLH